MSDVDLRDEALKIVAELRRVIAVFRRPPVLETMKLYGRFLNPSKSDLKAGFNRVKVPALLYAQDIRRRMGEQIITQDSILWTAYNRPLHTGDGERVADDLERLAFMLC